jgi:FdhD protein
MFQDDNTRTDANPDCTEGIRIKRIDAEGQHEMEDVVVKERPLTVSLNNQELVTLLCSPSDVKYLAIGFLSSEGLIQNKADIKNITIDENRGIVWVESMQDRTLPQDTLYRRFITSGCGRGASFYNVADVQADLKVDSPTTVTAAAIFNLMREFQQNSSVYRATGGVHGAALSDGKTILAFHEDIGRHNAVDKVFGDCILNDIPTSGKLVISSGRISSEILVKVARGNIPVLISKSAPTTLGLSLATELGITIVGFVRGQRMNVYTNTWRVTATA